MRPTIVAPATPPGTSALALVRLSGADAVRILETLTPPPVGGWIPRRAVVRTLHDADGRAVDQAVVTVYRAPHSFTGEDVVELSLHGNPVLVSHIVATCVAAGARLADAGAFTRRAVLAGKLDLPQAEAIAELIHAVSPQGAAMALGRLDGRLRAWAADVRTQITELLAQLTAAVDFPDEPIAPETSVALARRLGALAAALANQAAAARRARVWVDGAAVVLLGAPNAGKSTLLNRLLGEERAIVSPWAGTTRDFLTATTLLGGVPIRLIDTAGVRATTDPIEAEGIARAAAQARSADLVLLLSAPDAPADAALDALVAELDPARVLRIATKRDLVASGTTAAAPSSAAPVDLSISAWDSDDVAALVAAIAARLRPPTADYVVGTLRQERAVAAAATAVAAARARLEEGFPPEIVAEDVRAAAAALDRLIGTVDAEDVLDVVFSRFCIGK